MDLPPYHPSQFETLKFILFRPLTRDIQQIKEAVIIQPLKFQVCYRIILPNLGG